MTKHNPGNAVLDRLIAALEHALQIADEAEQHTVGAMVATCLDQVNGQR